MTEYRFAEVVVRQGWQWSFLTLVFVTLFSACGDDDTTTDDDAGTAQTDAGRDQSRDFGGGTEDTTIDLPRDVTEEPVIGTVTIQFLDGVTPVEGSAAFHDPAGNSLDYETSDEQGVLEIDVPAGAMMTLTTEDGNSRSLLTIVGLQPGDEIDINTPEDTWSAPQEVGQLSITVTAAIEDVNNYDFRLGYSGLGASVIDSPITGPIYDRDVTDSGTINVLGVASAFGERFGFVVFEDVTFVEDGVTTLTVDSWREDWTTFTINTSNAPEGTRQVGVDYAQLVDDLLYDGEGDGGPMTASDSTSFVFENVVPDFGQRLGYLAEVFYGEDESDGYTAFMTTVTGQPASADVDLSTDMLGRIWNVALDTTDPLRPITTWSNASDMSGSDVLLVVVEWNWNGYDWEWWFVLPPDYSSSFQFPELPDELVQWRLNANATWIDDPWVGYVDHSEVVGYDDVRMEFSEGAIFVERLNQLGSGHTYRVSSAGGNLF